MITINETLYKKMPDDIKLCFEQLPNPSAEEVRECFPQSGSGKLTTGSIRKKQPENCYKLGFTQKEQNDGQIAPDNYGDSGNASRFFKSILYYPKASKSERNKGCEKLEYKSVISTSNGGKENVKMTVGGASLKGKNKIPEPTKNNHPTVKPTALMSYLIKMITPKGGIVLEPFAGSGSTLVAARDNGFQYIGIEMTEEYLPIIQARTGCEIIKPTTNPIEKSEETCDKIVEEIKTESNIKVCPKCNGRLVKTKKGMTCEDCLEDF